MAKSKKVAVAKRVIVEPSAAVVAKSKSAPNFEKFPEMKPFDLEIHLTNQILKLLNAPSDQALNDKSTTQLFPAALELQQVVQPKDGIEALLSAQMAATHEMAMTFLFRAALPTQDTETVTICNDRANKLMRTFTTQMEALNRYRGKGQQKVTVEHVTVNHGGQAVIGTVERPQGGGGNERK
jgi:hypothetical protein